MMIIMTIQVVIKTAATAIATTLIDLFMMPCNMWSVWHMRTLRFIPTFREMLRATVAEPRRKQIFFTLNSVLFSVKIVMTVCQTLLPTFLFRNCTLFLTQHPYFYIGSCPVYTIWPLPLTTMDGFQGVLNPSQTNQFSSQEICKWNYVRLISLWMARLKHADWELLAEPISIMWKWRKPDCSEKEEWRRYVKRCRSSL